MLLSITLAMVIFWQGMATLRNLAFATPMGLAARVMHRTKTLLSVMSQPMALLWFVSMRPTGKITMVVF